MNLRDGNAAPPRLTPEQYLEIERKAEFKSEYFDGEMFAMSGGTRRHRLIATNIIVALQTLLNPVLIVEVLSKSTEAYDRDAKFKRYRQIQSLRGYLLAASGSIGIDYFTLGPDGRWTLTSLDQPEASLELDAIGCSLRVADVYEKVDFLA